MEALLTAHIPEKMRVLYITIWNGHKPMHEVLFPLSVLHQKFPKAKLEAACKWLLKNNLTDRKFVEWRRELCGDNPASYLAMHQRLLKEVEKTRYLRAVTIRDFNED